MHVSWIGAALYALSTFVTSATTSSVPLHGVPSWDAVGKIIVPIVLDDDSDDVPPKNCADLTDAEVRFPYATGSVGIYMWTQDCLVLGRCSSGTCIPNKNGASQNGGAGQPCKC